jgi:hypothetical protein
VIKKAGLFAVAPIAILSLSISGCAGGTWHNYGPDAGESLVPRTRDSGVHGKPCFLVALPDGSLVYADKVLGEIRRKTTDGAVVQFTESQGNSLDAVRLRRAQTDESSRRQLYETGPMMSTLSNMGEAARGPVLLHEFRPKNGKVRVVQYLDRKLRVVRTWEDTWPIRWRSSIREPLAIDKNDRIASTGEPGEIVVYGARGTVEERLVFPGVFNESRTLHASPLGPETTMYLTKSDAELLAGIAEMIADNYSELLRERDSTLPKPRPVVGDSFPLEVLDLAFAGDGRLLILDDKSQVYVLDMPLHQVEIVSIEGWMMKGAKEKVVQIRTVGGYLFELTEYRLLQIALAPRPRVVAEVSVPEGAGGPLAAWDVALLPPEKPTDPPGQAGIAVYFAGRLGAEAHRVVLPTPK